ncbi:hypothetical protein [Sphingomonas changbaiensis]|nr:hypothetical protein [Sphingomonas changbaiensis]
MSGYLVGSFFPAGYVNYLIRSRVFPETAVVDPPKFDRRRLTGAEIVTGSELLKALDANPQLFRSKFQGRPVKLVGIIQYFLEGSAGQDDMTLTLDTGSEYKGIFLTFDNPAAPGMTQLRKGEPVSATCMVSGTTEAANVHLNHCELWKD